MRLDSIVDEGKNTPTKKNLKFYLKKAYNGIEHFYNTNLSIKFKLLYESAALFSDRILTFVGVNYQGDVEGNPIMSKMFNYIGMIPAEICSYLFINIMFYLSSNKLHKKVGLKESEMLGSMYLGVGSVESLISFNNYLVLNNYNNFMSNMTYAQILLPTSVIVTAPFLYYIVKNKFSKGNSQQKV